MKAKIIWGGVVSLVAICILVVSTIATPPMQVKALRELTTLPIVRELNRTPSNKELLAEAEQWKRNFDMDFEIPKNMQRSEETSILEQNMQNMNSFREYLETLGYNLNCDRSTNLLESRLNQYYHHASQTGVIDTMSQVHVGITPLWTAGGPLLGKMVYNNGGTHQKIAGRAYDHLHRLFPSLFTPGNGTSNSLRAAFVRYADWPDTHGSFESLPFISGIHPTNNSHFYNPTNGFNWWANTVNPSINGRERTVFYFNRAVAYYNSGKKELALNNLGIASHFLSDLAAIVHADHLLPSETGLAPSTLAQLFAFGVSLLFNPIALGITAINLIRHWGIAVMVANHVAFESVSQNWVTGDGLQMFDVSLDDFSNSTSSVNHLAGAVAARSFMGYHQIGGRNSNVYDSWRILYAMAATSMAVNANATLLYMFAQATGHSVPLINNKTLQLGTYQMRLFEPIVINLDGNGNNLHINFFTSTNQIYFLDLQGQQLSGNLSSLNGSHAMISATLRITNLNEIELVVRRRSMLIFTSSTTLRARTSGNISLAAIHVTRTSNNNTICGRLFSFNY